MRVVLTGATGFVGRALLDRLLERGDEVLALGRDPRAMRRTLPAAVTCGRFDLDDPQPPAGLASGDVVVHCAALLGNARVSRDEMLRSNTNSVLVLARAAAAARAALFQFLSSVSALGPEGSEEQPLREDSPFHPVSPYGESKALTEQALAGVEGLAVQILRPPVIYGPGANTHSSASRIFRLMRGSLFFRCGAGHNRFNVMARENLVDAMLFLMDAALKEPGSPGGDPTALPPCPDTWMLRDDPCPTMRQMQDWIGACYGRSPLTLPIPWPLLAGLGALGDLVRARGFSFPFSREIARGFGTSGYYSDMVRLSRAGWQPVLSSEEAVRRTAIWYQSAGASLGA